MKPLWLRRLLLLEVMIENGLYHRANGGCKCHVCGRLYYDHPDYVSWLTLLCDGTLVHL